MIYNRSIRIVLAGACVTLAATTPWVNSARAQETTRPNIIVIMSDDMGFSDIGCYGGEISTPHLDGLAQNGVRFTQFYNNARCCPTRASLLTGLYPHQAGIGHMMDDRGHVGYRGELNKNCRTIAEVVRDAGYRTYMTGKWHVTRKTNPKDEAEQFNWPLQRGFDRFYGTIHGAGSFFDPNSLARDNTLISPFADPEYKPESYYYTDAISDQASRFISEHHFNTGDRPFFLYVSYTAAHWPMHAKPEDIEKYRGKYDSGYETIRKLRLAKSRSLGLLDPQWESTPTVEDWSKVDNVAWELRCMEVYAAMVDSMDQGIGQIIDTLRGTGQLDNTLILFLQDNGGCAEGQGRAPRTDYTSRPDKPPFPPMDPTALQMDMVPKQTRDGYPVVTGPGILPGTADTYIGYGRGWANVSNTPFREYKHWTHEGGISSPLIAHWPAGIPESRSGLLESQPTHLIDIAATCAALAGAKYPTDVDGQAIHALEGKNLQPAFVGNDLGRTSPIFWEHEGNRAVRDGKWKLVAKENRPWELYDMIADRTELHDLSATQPDLVTSLSAKWDEWAARANVLPLGTWRAAAPNTTPKKQNKAKAKKANDK